MAGGGERRVGNRERIVEVAAALLREEGRGAVTTRGVAERAGVQAPTIYRLFGDKDGLLEAVTEREMAAFASAKTAAVATASDAGVDPLEDLRTGWDLTIDFGLANPELYVLISDPGRGRRSPAAQAGMRLLAERIHRVALTGRLQVSEERAVELVHAAGTGAVLATLAKPAADRDRRLADAMFDTVLAQILTDTDAPVSERSDVVAHAVSLRAVASELRTLSVGEQTLLAEWLDRVITNPRGPGRDETADRR